MKLKKLVCFLLAMVMILSMTACKANEEKPVETEPAASVGEAVNYSVTVQSAGGMLLEGIGVYVYAANDLSDMKGFAETNAEGKAEMSLPQGGDYAIVLSGAPEGYAVNDTYSFNGTSASITLTSSLIQGENLSGASLGLGDVMYDFTIMAADGNEVTLSEMLSEKDMVLINFFYTTCGPCANEFPYMEEAYQQYKDSVGIIALDPLDDSNTVAAFQSSMGLTFPMASCQAAWSQTFGIQGYPTTLVIDRYGVICLISIGGETSASPFIHVFEYFSGDDYEQKLCPNGIADVKTVILPTETMPASEEIAATINNGEIPVTYRAEEGAAADTTWPFVITEKNGEACVKASNQRIESSYAIMYADVELKAGQAIGLDYMISSELGADAFVVIVNGEDIFQISGYNEVEVWESCYPWVADEDGTYEIALCYLKDETTDVVDDTVYVKNMRIVDASEVDAETHLPRQASTSEDGFTYSYVDVVLNEKDGYYHVGTADGPLLLANLMYPSEFNEESAVWTMIYENGLSVDGVDYYEAMEQYCNYASNAVKNGYCTVTEELAQLLQKVDQLYGFEDEDTNEWLRLCMYEQSYGPGVTQRDPIAGLATFSAYTAKLGKNVETNSFYYDRIIMPRGLLAEFVPSKSGVYRITSRNESANGVEGWIFDENHTELMVYEMDERLYNDDKNVSMVFYMEAGKSYYIDIAFWDPYEVGTIYYDIEYLGASRNHFRLCAPGYFTYDSDATGDAMYHLINAGIDVVLGDDGVYYEDLGDGKKGSKIYCDFTGVTALFSNPIASVPVYDENGNKTYDENGEVVMINGMIDMGGFDFSKTEDDLYVLGVLEAQDNDPQKAIDYLKAYWGEDYESYAEIYQLEDVLEGKYHGKGEDYTEEMRGYLDDIITSGSKELQGCVVVTERLAELLQLLMDKYTFENVDNSWIKLCYYYDYLGPNG